MVSSNQIPLTNTADSTVSSLSVTNNGGTDALTLTDSLLQTNNNDLSITTDDGYTLHINNNKPTAGDININENSRNSNVNIVNGNLNIRNGYLNLGNGSLILDGADINAVLVGNSYQLSIQADTLANHGQTIDVHGVNIQQSVDVGVENATKIITIENNYAPLDAPVFTTSLTVPPILVAENTNISATQIGYLSNLQGDVQTALNTINSTIGTVQSKQIVDASNISILQSSLAVVTSNQIVDEANISSLQSSVSTLNTKQATDEINIQNLQSSVSTLNTKQATDEINILSLLRLI
jgi:hypothetical protein